MVRRISGKYKASTLSHLKYNGIADVRDICNTLAEQFAWLQTTQPTSGVAVTVDSNCNGGPIYRFWGMPATRTRWMALLLTKAGDVGTNPGPTTLNKSLDL